MMTDHHAFPRAFHSWIDEYREVAFLRRTFGDERVEAMMSRREHFDRALIAKTMPRYWHHGSYRAAVPLPGCLTCQPTADACLVQRAHDAAVRHLETYGEKLFEKGCETFRMAADVDLSTEVGIACHLLWAQSSVDQSTETRRIAIDLDGHELWVTSHLDWQNVAYLAANPFEPRYREFFEFSLLAVDERVIPDKWLPPSL